MPIRPSVLENRRTWSTISTAKIFTPRPTWSADVPKDAKNGTVGRIVRTRYGVCTAIAIIASPYELDSY